MLVIDSPNIHANRSERRFAEHVARAGSGVVVLNVLVGGGKPGRPGREIDALVITPRGMVCTEVKQTTASGDLHAPANGAWAVGDDPAPFPTGSKSPSAQADQATKILASTLDRARVRRGYITPAVAVDGDVQIPEQVRYVGTVAVTTLDRFDQVLSRQRGKRLTVAAVQAALTCLGIAPDLIPDEDALTAEGFATVDTEQAPQPSVDDAVPATPPTRAWSAGAVRTRVGLLLPLALTLAAAVAALVTGVPVVLLTDPAPGDVYFLYGPWQEGWGFWPGAFPATPGAAPLLVLALTAIVSVALYLRSRVCPLFRVEVMAYLAAVFAAVAGAPVLFAETGWVGVGWALMWFTVGWPTVALLAHAFGGPVLAGVAKIRRDYVL